jgi:hypothetical protein
VLLIPGLLLIMGAVRRHYHRVFLETRSAAPLELNDLSPPLVIVPIKHWSHIVKKALRFALKISPNVRAVHVDCGEGALRFGEEWCRFVEEPTREAGVATPQLVVFFRKVDRHLTASRADSVQLALPGTARKRI